MKSIKTRLISAFLLVMTILSLFPTTAFAATSTGTGIKPTSNTNYWTTRLLHDGTPYSYKPPMAAGKLLYCLDRGYGYRWGTKSSIVPMLVASISMSGRRQRPPGSLPSVASIPRRCRRPDIDLERGRFL